jgi:hypothetical protein
VARPNLVTALVTVEPVSSAASDSDVSKTVNRVAVLAVWGDFKMRSSIGVSCSAEICYAGQSGRRKAKLLHLPEEDSLATAHVDDGSQQSEDC